MRKRCTPPLEDTGIQLCCSSSYKVLDASIKYWQDGRGKTKGAQIPSFQRVAAPLSWNLQYAVARNQGYRPALFGTAFRTTVHPVVKVE